jgi:hypothetical protein
MAIRFFTEAAGANIAFLPALAFLVTGSLAFDGLQAQPFNQFHTCAVALSR